MVFVNYIYDMVVDTQFHKFYGRPFARVIYLFIPHERYRSVTPLGVTRVNRTVLQGRCCPQPFCARILYNLHGGRGKICMILLLHVKQNKTKLSKNSHPHNTIIGSGYFSFERLDYLSDETSKIHVRTYDNVKTPFIYNMVFENYIYDMVVDTQFNKFHGRPFARVLHVFLMTYIGR